MHKKKKKKKRKKEEAKNPKNMCIHLVHGCNCVKPKESVGQAQNCSIIKSRKTRERERERELPDKTK